MPVRGCEDLVRVAEHGEGGADVEEDCALDLGGVVD